MDCVKLKFSTDSGKQKDDTETLLYWPASRVPTDAKFNIETAAKTKKSIITAETTAISFSSKESEEDDGNYNYYIATRDSHGKLVCRPAQMYRMFPNYAFKDEANQVNDDEAIRLTKREQMDELKEKFGSRKSQRDLASKRKYEIQFGEDDVDNLPTIKEERNDGETSTLVSEESVDSEQPKTVSTILPPRNENASTVEDVYLLRDIITEKEESAIKDYEETLFAAIKNEYIKSLSGKGEEDPQVRLMAIYADLLLQLVKLSAYEMRKADPLPLVEGDIKKCLFDRYTSTMQSSGRSMRYVITDKDKDRIFVYVFLLIIMLNRYKPIELEKLQSNCKIPMTNIRRMLELIGCYMENARGRDSITVKVARFRLPLNVYKEPRKKFRR